MAQIPQLCSLRRAEGADRKLCFLVGQIDGDDFVPEAQAARVDGGEETRGQGVEPRGEQRESEGAQQAEEREIGGGEQDEKLE